MDFGTLIFTKPERAITDVKYAEERGFSHAWIPDSHMIWGDTYACMALAAVNTKKIKLADRRGDSVEQDCAGDGAFDRHDQPARPGTRDFRIRHGTYGAARDGTSAGQAGGLPRAGARDSRSASRRRSDLQHRRAQPKNQIPASRSALYQPRRPDSALRGGQRSQDAGARGRVWRRRDHDGNNGPGTCRSRAKKHPGGRVEGGSQRGQDADRLADSYLRAEAGRETRFATGEGDDRALGDGEFSRNRGRIRALRISAGGGRTGVQGLRGVRGANEDARRRALPRVAHRALHLRRAAGAEVRDAGSDRGDDDSRYEGGSRRAAALAGAGGSVAGLHQSADGRLRRLHRRNIARRDRADVNEHRTRSGGCDFGERDRAGGDRGNVVGLGRTPHRRRTRARSNRERVLEHLRDVRVDAQTVGRKRLGDFAVANNVRVAGDGAGEISRALAVDWIGVPDAADVDSVADGAHQFAVADSAVRAHHDVGAGRAGTRVEAPAAAFAQPVTA